MKKLLMMLFLFLISIFSYAEKTAEEIMSDLREKEQEKIKQQEEVKKQKQTTQAKIEKEAEKLMKMKKIKKDLQDFIMKVILGLSKFHLKEKRF